MVPFISCKEHVLMFIPIEGAEEGEMMGPQILGPTAGVGTVGEAMGAEVGMVVVGADGVTTEVAAGEHVD